ncbi:MAG: hypothetical protein C0514_00005 [Candidatus Puniceispirillum sp.]|nr:hypothetical protein [Candidatus Puniceispirillum sp.]
MYYVSPQLTLRPSLARSKLESCLKRTNTIKKDYKICSLYFPNLLQKWIDSGFHRDIEILYGKFYALLIMTTLYLSTALCLSSLLTFTVCASSAFTESEISSARSTPQGAHPQAGKAKSGTFNIDEWRKDFLENTQRPVSQVILERAATGFASQGQMADWILLIDEQIPRVSLEDAYHYLTHLGFMTSKIDPRGKGLTMVELSRYFPDEKKLPKVAECFLRLNLAYFADMPTHVQERQDMFITKFTFLRILEILSTHYLDRIMSSRGALSLEECGHITRIIGTAYQTPLRFEMCTGSGWERTLLEKIIEHTNGISQDDLDYTRGFLRLANAEASKNPMDAQTAQSIINENAHIIGQKDLPKYVTSWTLPLLAMAYKSLNRGEECVQTWLEYEKHNHADDRWRFIDQVNGLEHVSKFTQKAPILERWWQRFAKVNEFHEDRLMPIPIALRAITHAVSGFARLNRHEQVIDLAKKTIVYLDTFCESLLKDPQTSAYKNHHFNLSLSLARSLTELGRYEEAAKIYEQYFEYDAHRIYMKIDGSVPEEELGRIQQDLMPDIQNAAVAFAQAGRLNADPKVRIQETLKQKASSRKKRNKKPTHAHRAPLREGYSIANAAKDHLFAHYTKRIEDLLLHLKDMDKEAQKLSISVNFSQRIQEHTVHVLNLQKQLTQACEQARQSQNGKKNASSRSESSYANNTPSLSQVGQAVMAFKKELAPLEKDLERAKREYEMAREKEIKAYLAALSKNQQGAAPFSLIDVAPERPLPQQGTKVKTRGTATPQGETVATQPPQSAPAASPPTTLFMKQQAQADYAQLSPAFRDKFHAFAQEIAQNPFQIMGGLGRPESLESHEGIFFSRRLSKGDRVVYEVIKDGTNPTKVIFLTLLSHYKHLARHQESARANPLILKDKAPEDPA